MLSRQERPHDAFLLLCRTLLQPSFFAAYAMVVVDLAARGAFGLSYENCCR